MRVGLLNDSHNYPSLPSMKLSAWHKSRGDSAGLWRPDASYDRVYVSKVFRESILPDVTNAAEIICGGSGFDLKNKLPHHIEHIMPDYSLYPQFDFAIGFLTRGCPRVNHSFCITPKKDGCKSLKVADLSEFWAGQKDIVLLDQNLLACKDRMDLLHQLAESGAVIDFDGGMDARFINDEVIQALRPIKVKDFHFAWDDPREDLIPKFQKIIDSGLKNPRHVGVYVLTNYWSTPEQDLYRVNTLKSMGFSPFVMIYNKHLFVDPRGHWIPGVEYCFSEAQLQHFKFCQHLQRWTGNRRLLQSCDFQDYDRYARWVKDGKRVPRPKV